MVASSTTLLFSTSSPTGSTIMKQKWKEPNGGNINHQGMLRTHAATTSSSTTTTDLGVVAAAFENLNPLNCKPRSGTTTTSTTTTAMRQKKRNDKKIPVVTPPMLEKVIKICTSSDRLSFDSKRTYHQKQQHDDTKYCGGGGGRGSSSSSVLSNNSTTSSSGWSSCSSKDSASATTKGSSCHNNTSDKEENTTTTKCEKNLKVVEMKWMEELETMETSSSSERKQTNTTSSSSTTINLLHQPYHSQIKNENTKKDELNVCNHVQKPFAPAFNSSRSEASDTAVIVELCKPTTTQGSTNTITTTTTSSSNIEKVDTSLLETTIFIPKKNHLRNQKSVENNNDNKNKNKSVEYSSSLWLDAEKNAVTTNTNNKHNNNSLSFRDEHTIITSSSHTVVHTNSNNNSKDHDFQWIPNPDNTTIRDLVGTVDDHITTTIGTVCAIPSNCIEDESDPNNNLIHDSDSSLSSITSTLSNDSSPFSSSSSSSSSSSVSSSSIAEPDTSTLLYQSFYLPMENPSAHHVTTDMNVSTFVANQKPKFRKKFPEENNMIQVYHNQYSPDQIGRQQSRNHNKNDTWENKVSEYHDPTCDIHVHPDTIPSSTSPYTLHIENECHQPRSNKNNSTPSTSAASTTTLAKHTNKQNNTLIASTNQCQQPRDEDIKQESSMETNAEMNTEVNVFGHPHRIEPDVHNNHYATTVSKDLFIKHKLRYYTKQNDNLDQVLLFDDSVHGGDVAPNTVSTSSSSSFTTLADHSSNVIATKSDHATSTPRTQVRHIHNHLTNEMEKTVLSKSIDIDPSNVQYHSLKNRSVKSSDRNKHIDSEDVCEVKMDECKNHRPRRMSEKAAQPSKMVKYKTCDNKYMSKEAEREMNLPRKHSLFHVKEEMIISPCNLRNGNHTVSSSKAHAEMERALDGVQSSIFRMLQKISISQLKRLEYGLTVLTDNEKETLAKLSSYRYQIMENKINSLISYAQSLSDLSNQRILETEREQLRDQAVMFMIQQQYVLLTSSNTTNDNNHNNQEQFNEEDKKVKSRGKKHTKGANSFAILLEAVQKCKEQITNQTNQQPRMECKQKTQCTVGPTISALIFNSDQYQPDQQIVSNNASVLSAIDKRRGEFTDPRMDVSCPQVQLQNKIIREYPRLTSVSKECVGNINVNNKVDPPDENQIHYKKFEKISTLTPSNMRRDNSKGMTQVARDPVESKKYYDDKDEDDSTTTTGSSSTDNQSNHDSDDNTMNKLKAAYTRTNYRDATTRRNSICHQQVGTNAGRSVNHTNRKKRRCFSQKQLSWSDTERQLLEI